MTIMTQMMLIATFFKLSCIILCSHAENTGPPTVIYVAPNASIFCPEMPCLTLSQYTRDQDAYIGTDTELHLLSGVHRLSGQIIIKGGINRTKLALVGQGKPVIITGRQVSLKLIELNSLSLKSLHFSGITVLVGNSSRLVMSDLQFTAINGSAFVLENIDNIVGTNITICKSSDAHSAGVIIRLSNVVFTNMTVENNLGSSILVIEESFVHFKEISTFTNNSAIKGSTLMIKTGSVTFDGSILFQSNRCKGKGGAMNIVDSNVSFTSNIELYDNFAQDGGAIQLDHSVLTMNGLIEISNNWIKKTIFSASILGGAINSIQSDITMTGMVTFGGNRIDAFFQNGFGGAMCAQKSRITLSGTISFHDNVAEGLTNYGGAILLTNSTLVATNTMLTFTNNSAQKGGAIAITGMLQLFKPSQSIIKVEGTSVFDANVGIIAGSDLFGEYQVMHILFSGNTTMSRYRGLNRHVALMLSLVFIRTTIISDIQFHGYTEIKDSYSTGMIVNLRGNISAIFSGVTKFMNNTGLVGGYVLEDNASITFIGQTFFESNHGVGGIIRLENSKPSMISGEFLFLDNDSGMHLSNSEIKLEGDLRFNFTTRCISDPRYGCITAFGSTVTINGSMLIDSGNIANTVPVIYSYSTSIKMYGNCKFINHNNIFGDGGAVFSLRSTLHLDGNVSFISNSASGRGGAICALYSELFLHGNHFYANNSANAGGVISLGILTVIHFSELAVTFDNNRAERGAIFHHDDILNAIDCLNDASIPFLVVPFSVRTECFFSKPNNVNVTNIGNNIASDIGNVIFGGNLERCSRENAAETFINLFHTDDSIRNITSNPYQVVFCENDKPVTTTRLRESSNIAIKTIPGKLFPVSVAGLNQLLKPISSTIRAEISKSSFTARLGSFQSSQLTNDSCTTLYYRVFSQASHINFTVYAEGPCNKLGTAAIVMSIELGSCPDGFQLVGDECICEADLLKYTTVCSVDDESIQNGGNFWAGGWYDDNGSYVGIVTFPNCPFDYCIKETINFTLRNPDKQCAHYRSGSICGQCMMNYSLSLGDVQCSDCSMTNPGVTLGFLLLFALVGIIFVVLLNITKDDSSIWNPEWPSILCQHCRCKQGYLCSTK
jgi:predicted outer membrane repeat protein